ncbi:hypothetical protein GD416_34960 [Burkholderia sp. BE24]|uniref:hypothetical protein n=2 Tax=Burkholderia TaxID=32008 RepID=UPI00117E48EA|nr:hypothetical protein [Burkholderia sp. HI2761]MPV61468.1 hypothetical protein [Burkholderia sp. BE24]
MQITNWKNGCNSDKDSPGGNEGLLGVGSKNTKTSATAQAFQDNFNNLIRRLNIKNIRVGGTSADSVKQRVGDASSRAYPPLQTAKNVIDFAKEVGLTELEWNLPVYGVDVSTYFNYAASLLEYKNSTYPKLKLIFEIGNEDNNTRMSYASWLASFKSYVSGIYKLTSDSLKKNLYFTGPSTAGQGWNSNIVNDSYFVTDNISEAQIAGVKSLISYVNTHEYPLGGGYTSPCLAPGVTGSGTTCLSLVSKLLAQGAYDPSNFTATLSKVNLSPRLMEINSMYGGGIAGAGDSFAAALWALNNVSWFAQNSKLAGLNLHLGATNGGYSPITPPFTNGSGNNALPTLKADGYGMLTYGQFNQGGKIIVPSVVGLTSRISVFGALQPDGHLRMLIINRNWTDNGNDPVIATVTVPSGYSTARTMSLAQSGSNPMSPTGISLGGSGVASDGAWSGVWTAASRANADGTYTFTVPPVQAMVVDFSK